jgi:hypothetical protein
MNTKTTIQYAEALITRSEYRRLAAIVSNMASALSAMKTEPNSITLRNKFSLNQSIATATLAGDDEIKASVLRKLIADARLDAVVR